MLSIFDPWTAGGQGRSTGSVGKTMTNKRLWAPFHRHLFKYIVFGNVGMQQKTKM